MDQKQVAIDKYDQERGALIVKNMSAYSAVTQNSTSKMERIFKTGGLGKAAIDHLIFVVKSVDMLKLFLQFGGPAEPIIS